ncbi:MAG TPA: hypothetical protein PKH65_04455 [Bacteroidia bacterium]|nr:hypothetical protein [Bacteroidia bacterium]HNT79911.1 hypothetical protein [Bacteroidia bacterium]
MKWVFPLILCLIGNNVFAGGDEPLTSPHSTSMGLSGATHQGIWSSFHNQAGLSQQINGFEFALTHQSRYFINSISQQGLALAMPFQDKSVMALSFTRFGYEFYNEQKAGLAYARNFGDKVSASLQFDYLLLNISENYGKRSAFTVEAGLQAKLTDKLLLGMHAYNPLASKVADFNEEKAPVIISGGLRYFASDKVNVLLEGSKDSDYPASVSAGIEYHITEPLIIRSGISTQSTLFTFGASILLSNISIDVAAAYDQILGFSPQIGISYGRSAKK